MKGDGIEVLNGFELRYLADTTRNAAFAEEYRARNCVNRFDGNPSDCDCWACVRYGLQGYAIFQLHPDSYPPETGLYGKCWCWVCEMSQYDGSVYDSD
jgi:hypothetical protein